VSVAARRRGRNRRKRDRVARGAVTYSFFRW
jgi:hypothetical protein